MRIKLSDHFTLKRLLKFVFPSIIMMIIISIYGVIDGFFVSNYVGKSAFSSLNLVMPFIMILGGMGFMIGTGGSALVSKTLGQKENEKANKIFSMMIVFTTILGLILSIIGIIFIRPVSYLLGASDEMIDNCVLYGRIVTSFTALFMLQNVFQSFLATAEKPKIGLIVTIAAGTTNAVLDYLFVAVFNFGLAGAAVATGIGQVVGGLIPLIYFILPNDSLLKLVKTKLSIKELLAACANGSSELMSNDSSSIVGMVYNLQLMKYIGEDGVATYGVLMYVQFVFVAIFIGYSIGTAPIVGYNYGATNYDELKNVRKKSIAIMFTTGITLSIIAQLLAGTLAKIFVGYDQNLYVLTVHAFRIFSFAFILTGFNIFSSSFFTALNNGAISALIAFLRTLVFQLGSVLMLPLIISVDGIWLAICVAEVFATAISLFFMITKQKVYHY